MWAQARTLEKIWAPQTVERVLADHPLLKGCEPRYIQLLAECARNVQFNTDEVIFRQGEEADQFYLIRRGRVALEIPTPQGGPIILQTAGQGDFLGWSWMITPYRWHFDARAVELTRAVALDGRDLREKCDSDHDFGYEVVTRVARIMELRLQATRLQLLDIYGICSNTSKRRR
jgi:CRP/FNR family cyclic AMP-dependent transcriptional regulator